MGNDNIRSKISIPFTSSEPNFLSDIPSAPFPLTSELDYKNPQQHFTFAPDGTITFSFIHFTTQYDKLTQSIQTFKSVLKILSPYELKALLFKLDQLKKHIINDEFLSFTNYLIDNMQNSYNSFYLSFKSLFKLNKQFYISSQSYIEQWFKEESNQNLDTSNTIKEAKEKNEEIKHEYKHYHMFTKENKAVTQMSDFFHIQDKIIIQDYKKLNEFYNENLNEFNNAFSFESFKNFRDFVNLIEQIKEFIQNKNYLMELFMKVVDDTYKLYFEVINGLAKSNEESSEIMTELKEFYHLMIKHRYIRHVEEKIKELDKIELE